MSYAPGCEPDAYTTPDTPDGFEWRRQDDVRIGDVDQFDRPVTEIQWSKNGNSLRIRAEGMVTIDRIARAQPSERSLFRVRPDA